MTDTSSPNTQSPQTVAETDFMLTLTIIFLLTTGGMLLIFSAAYIKDLQTLRTIPDAIWSAICGRPVEGGITLPLLLTFATLSFLASGVIFGYQRLRKHFTPAR